MEGGMCKSATGFLLTSGGARTLFWGLVLGTILTLILTAKGLWVVYSLRAHTNGEVIRFCPERVR